jgi:hypothetical protein
MFGNTHERLYLGFDAVGFMMLLYMRNCCVFPFNNTALIVSVMMEDVDTSITICRMSNVYNLQSAAFISGITSLA